MICQDKQCAAAWGLFHCCARLCVPDQEVKEAAAASERALAERCREALEAMQSQKCALEVRFLPSLTPCMQQE